MAFSRIIKWVLIGSAATITIGAAILGAGAYVIHKRLSDLSIHSDAPECRADKLLIGGPWGYRELTVELADTKESRDYGLMFRTSLAPDTGMLFFHDAPGAYAYWMRNTLIPLDLLFFDAKGDMRHVHFGARPHDETPISGGDQTLYVLEVAAGEVTRLGIGARSTIRHPNMPQDVARWKC